MPFSAADVPSGPYFHGTRSQIAVRASLIPGTIDPGAGNDREVVWATTDPAQALKWAEQRYRSTGDTLYVYEVDLVDPEVDTNYHRDWETGQFTSVMAPAGTVKGLTRSTPAV